MPDPKTASVSGTSERVGAKPDVLFAETYDHLRQLASRQLGSMGSATLDPTVLVHDLYLRIGSRPDLAFSQPEQFYAYAARAIRHLVIDRARSRSSRRAGGDWLRVTLTASDGQLVLESATQALALDRSIDRLAEADPRAAKVVELVYFGGMTLAQAAAALGVVPRTVCRDWKFARAFARRHRTGRTGSGLALTGEPFHSSIRSAGEGDPCRSSADSTRPPRCCHPANARLGWNAKARTKQCDGASCG